MADIDSKKSSASTQTPPARAPGPIRSIKLLSPEGLVVPCCYHPGCRHGLDQCRDAVDRDLDQWIQNTALPAAQKSRESESQPDQTNHDKPPATSSDPGVQS